MELKDALVAAMQQNQIKDAHVAVMLDVNPETVRFWRAGVQQPRFIHAQKLRTKLPGFADLLDGRISHAA